MHLSLVLVICAVMRVLMLSCWCHVYSYPLCLADIFLNLAVYICVFYSVDFEVLDLASQKSVREFVRRFRERKLPLHILINNGEFNFLIFLFWFHFRFISNNNVNNVSGDTRSWTLSCSENRWNPKAHRVSSTAGVMLVPEEETDDGFELHFSVNYLGHVLLTRLLLDTLIHSGMEECSRIISICSSAHYMSDRNLQDFCST